MERLLDVLGFADIGEAFEYAMDAGADYDEVAYEDDLFDWLVDNFTDISE